jgi:IrrE N-terminal-like domain
LDLRPPVDVEALLERVADVEYCDWDFECDGLVVGLATARPKAFIREGVPPRRRRFTVAHELGHVQLIWHLDSVFCTSSEGSAVPGVRPPGGSFFQEQEADRFASGILLPRRFLTAIPNAYDRPVPEMLNDLARANVSAFAGLLALKEVLLPGYVFDLPGAFMPIRSAGTPIDSYPSRSDLRKASIAHGRELHQGQPVDWYVMVDTAGSEPEPFVTDRSAIELLGEIAARVWPGEPERAKAVHSSIGGVLSKHREMNDPKTLRSILESRLSTNQHSELMEDSEAADFITLRAQEIARKRGWTPPKPS